MKVPLWAHETAALFWEAVGVLEPFPRFLREPICRSAFDLTVKEMPGLSTRLAERYLTRLSPCWTCGRPDRSLRACLAARDGAGFILLDADDPDAELVFSLAHELAHFLWHYWRLRNRAGKLLGNLAIEVFDGRRPPTHTERLRALLSNVPLGPHVHLMERDLRGSRITKPVAVIEQEADRLAYELLAPAHAVAKQSTGHGVRRKHKDLAIMLQDSFGLPTNHAHAYSHLLLPRLIVDPLVQRLSKKR